jgi:hypothetical protein
MREQILTRAAIQVQPAINRANELIPSGAEWGMKAYRIMFGNELALIEQAPENWFKQRTAIGLRGLAVGDFRELQLKLPAPVRWPESIEENDFVRPAQYGYEAVEVKPHPAWDELRAAYTVYREASDAAYKKKEMYVKSVEKIISTYSTLAPALKAWPPLWDLLHINEQNEHRRVDAPRKREEKEISVDFDTLTSISTAAKFGV